MPFISFSIEAHFRLVRKFNTFQKKVEKKPIYRFTKPDLLDMITEGSTLKTEIFNAMSLAFTKQSQMTTEYRSLVWPFPKFRTSEFEKQNKQYDITTAKFIKLHSKIVVLLASLETTADNYYNLTCPTELDDSDLFMSTSDSDPENQNPKKKYKRD